MNKPVQEFKPLNPERVMEICYTENCLPDKTCPLKEGFGNLSRIKCTKERCGWWDDAHKQCAIITIANR